MRAWQRNWRAIRTGFEKHACTSQRTVVMQIRRVDTFGRVSGTVGRVHVSLQAAGLFGPLASTAIFLSLCTCATLGHWRGRVQRNTAPCSVAQQQALFAVSIRDLLPALAVVVLFSYFKTRVLCRSDVCRLGSSAREFEFHLPLINPNLKASLLRGWVET
ncbi:LAQU0S01e03334g1_1 [Lachancea quebecensis]|uniref:LAQU0S01e03334g1_1 n=1 Tax=Lachancea quebecensis TaxID=1654605 RepID=A0A0P1KLV0_9SACH|nr:LAQU0S01e03334g1_1 [Lachancea quebecensis]